MAAIAAGCNIGNEGWWKDLEKGWEIVKGDRLARVKQKVEKERVERVLERYVIGLLCKFVLFYNFNKLLIIFINF